MTYFDRDYIQFNQACAEYAGGPLSASEGFNVFARGLGVQKIELIVYTKGTPAEPECLYEDNTITASDSISRQYPASDEVLELRLSLSEPSNDTVSVFMNDVYLCISNFRLRTRSMFNLMHDAMTGIHNQEYFMRNLFDITANRNVSDYVAFYMNIRNCRFLNKVFGNYATDEIIKYFSINFDAQLEKEKGECLARLGGDFFTLIVLKENLDKYIKLITAFPVDLTYKTDRISYTISLRAGAAKLTSAFDSPDKIMAAITAAFSLSKNTKADPPIIFYDNSIADTYYAADERSNELRAALNDEKILVYYQPYIKFCESVGVSSIIGCEALVRWRREDRMVIPEEMLPIAEKYGFITDIDLYVLRKVCSKIRQWREEGIPVVPTAINFSEYDLKISDLASRVISIIDEYGIHHSLITIEFTETAFFNDPVLLQHTINELNAAGIKVGVDNCSDSFFSFKTLTEHKFDYIKIDFRSIDTTDTKKIMVLKCVISLSRELGIDVVIEGASDPSLIDDIKKTGCTIFQTNYYEKAMSERFFENKLKNM